MIGPRAGLLVLALVGASCAGDAVGPAKQPGQNPGTDSSSVTIHFLTAAAGAPTVANPVIRFYARTDQTREVQMYYHARPGQNDSSVFLDFKVPDRSLLRRPDGTAFGSTDSVLITLTLTDSTHLITDFQPAGLQFSADRPARLQIKYGETDRDVNGDGVVDQTDQQLTLRFQVWRKESATSPWFSLSSIVEVGLDDVQADILGFTSYAIGY